MPNDYWPTEHKREVGREERDKLLEKLEALIEKWTDEGYYTNAEELRKVIGSLSGTWHQDKSSSDARLQQGYFDYDNDPF